jgi:1,3-beta-glucan synthase
LKQTKLRRRRVIRYAILYFFLLFVFIIVIAGPVIIGGQKSIAESITKPLSKLSMPLIQPGGLGHNDTKATPTGFCLNTRDHKCLGPGGAAVDDSASASASATDASSRLLLRMLAY